MQLSSRITEINAGGSDGWGVFYRARQMVAAGTDIIELTIGEHDIRTDPTILNVMHQAALSGHTGYAAVPGIFGLRQAIATRIQAQSGVPTGPENILVTPGGQAALFATHMAVCNQGDTALFIDPYYTTYPGSLRAIGANPVAISARPEHGFQPQAGDIALHAAQAKSLLINSPNNPTGAVYTGETLAGIAQVCQDHDLWLISDEVYETQVWHGTHISPRSLPGMADRTLIVGSMSKGHAMTGSRIGWICGPTDAIAALTDLATNTTYGVPGYIQDAALFALEQGDALEQKVNAPFARRRALTMQMLDGQNVVQNVPPDGAMYVMLDIRATGLSGEDFANRLLDEKGIAVMPGESFGNAAAGHIRVAMTVDDDRYGAALKRLIAFATAHAT